MRLSKTVVIILVLCSLSVMLVSCASESDSTVSESQVVFVQRGDLTVDITAVGNLSLSLKEDLAFEIGGTTQEPLSVEEILVEEGDTAEEGQVLARLDTASLEKAVQAAEMAMKTKELDLWLADESVIAAEIDLEIAANDYQRLITPYPFLTYEFILPEAVGTIGVVQARIKEALEENQQGLVGEQYSMAEVRAKLLEAQKLLTEAEIKLAWGFDEGIRPSGLEYWTLRETQINVEKADSALSRAKASQEKAKLALDSARDDLDEAKGELEKAVILAPFDGFITRVNVEGGDEAMKGTVAVQLADPTKFEADLLVSEMDILQIKQGGEAWVQVDAMPGMSLPAKVTHISPTATIQSGVVNYEVKVEIQSLEAVRQEGQKAGQDISSGELPEQIKQAIEEFQLREGLTVTVSILLDDRTDVLMVPNAAITSQSGETYVQVALPDGTTEERSIATGISNWQYTEVTDGLSEGEEVVVPQGTATTPQQGSPRGMIIPGMGRPPHD